MVVMNTAAGRWITGNITSTTPLQRLKRLSHSHIWPLRHLFKVDFTYIAHFMRSRLSFLRAIWSEVIALSQCTLVSANHVDWSRPKSRYETWWPWRRVHINTNVGTYCSDRILFNGGGGNRRRKKSVNQKRGLTSSEVLTKTGLLNGSKRVVNFPW